MSEQVFMQELLEQELEIKKEIEDLCRVYADHHNSYLLEEFGGVRFFDEVESIEFNLDQLRWLLNETRLAIHEMKSKNNK